jgi:undecaprenyl-diphosphatase
MKPGSLILAALLAGVIVIRWRRASMVVRCLAVLGVVGLVIYGSGIVHPPGLEVMIADATGALGPYTYALVGMMAFMETGAFIGLIAPGELVVILGGVSAGRHETELIALIALVWACALAGDLTSYALGRRLGREFLVRHGSVVGITERRLKRVELFFAAHGAKTIIVGRFIGLVRALAPFIAGASRMPARRFIPCSTIASGVWAGSFCLLGYVFWHSLPELIEITRRGTLAFAGAVAVAVAGVALYRHLRRRRARALRPTRLPASD